MIKFPLRHKTSALLVLLLLPWNIAASETPSALKTKADLEARKATRLKPAEITDLIAGNTLSVQLLAGDRSGGVRTYTFDPDGGFLAKNGWDSLTDGYRWYLGQSGTLCLRYRSWYNKKIICREMYRLDGMYYWVKSDGIIEAVVNETTAVPKSD